MKTYYVELGIHGCDGLYTEALMVGNFPPDKVFESFSDKRVLSKSGNYLSVDTYKNHEEDVCEKLFKHFVFNGCSRVKPKTYEIGD